MAHFALIDDFGDYPENPMFHNLLVIEENTILPFDGFLIFLDISF